MGRHEVELVVWKADGPVHSCKYTITVKRQKPEQLKPSPRIGKSSCTRPHKPEGGIVVCDREGLKRRHPHGSVCQFFCLEHTQNSTVSVCEDGRWLPGDNVSCTVTTCRAPSPPSHGTWDCETEEGPREGGAKCKIRCDADYVVPTSQLQRSTILCTPPSWNDSIQTLCQIARRPNLQRCHDRQVMVRAGFKTKLSEDLLPKVSDLPQSSAPTCSLQGLDLPGGHHRNYCRATDPELRTEANCSYTISVEESSVPQPHPDDCQNQTILENDVRTFPTRFLVRVGEPARIRVLQSTCTPMGDISVGTHLISCHATDPATNAESYCSFWLTVKETCRLLQPPARGSLSCTQSGRVQECRVTCNPGFGLSGQMEPLLVSCEDGLWDFQTDNQTANLPDCLAQMESSAVKVWMGFEASASHCDEDMERQVEEIVSGLCPPGTDCEGSFNLNCTVDEESDTVLLYIEWTVQADFEDPDDDSKEEEIPEAEARLEAALERVRSFLSTGEVPGLHLFRDSFRRGPITLVCPDGFTADMMAAKCVRCPPVDETSNVQCPPCGCKDSFPDLSPDQG